MSAELRLDFNTYDLITYKRKKILKKCIDAPLSDEKIQELISEAGAFVDETLSPIWNVSVFLQIRPNGWSYQFLGNHRLGINPQVYTRQLTELLAQINIEAEKTNKMDLYALAKRGNYAWEEKYFFSKKDDPETEDPEGEVEVNNADE